MFSFFYITIYLKIKTKTVLLMNSNNDINN